MSTSYTRSAHRRAGDYYQDLIALEKCIRWLEQPEKYKWIRLEADNEFKSLDDVICCTKDVEVELYQVKHSLSPELERNQISLGYLLQRTNGKSSLLQKWSSSFFYVRANYRIILAEFVTNKKPHHTFKNLLDPNNQLNISRLPNGKLRKVHEQCSGEVQAEQFLSEFKFRLAYCDRKSLKQDLFERILSRGGDPQALLNQIVEWIISDRNSPNPDGNIYIKDIKEAAKLKKAKQLYQDFKIPEDFVLPNRHFFESFKYEVVHGKNRIIHLSGVAGVGKSTFLSFLYQDLVKKEIPVIRHHYYLQGDDHPKRRLDHRIVLESLMSSLKLKYPESLQDRGEEDETFDRFYKWLQDASNYLAPHTNLCTRLGSGSLPRQ